MNTPENTAFNTPVNIIVLVITAVNILLNISANAPERILDNDFVATLLNIPVNLNICL